jgi:hypothetical protein
VLAQLRPVKPQLIGAGRDQNPGSQQTAAGAVSLSHEVRYIGPQTPARGAAIAETEIEA